MRYLIVATSGTGKSFFRRSAFGKGTGIPVADGDDIINSQGGYPKRKIGGKHWWEIPAERQRVSEANVKMILDALERNKDLSVVWWADLFYLVEGLKRRPRLLRSLKLVGVQIPLDQLKERWEGRNRDIDAGISGHSKRPWEAYVKSWKDAGEWMTKYGIQTYPSFDALVKSSDLFVRRTSL